MNRTGLLIALAIAVVAGLVFGLYPGLDLEVARYFHGFVDRSHNMFALRIYPPLMKARDIGLGLAPSWWRPPYVRSLSSCCCRAEEC